MGVKNKKAKGTRGENEVMDALQAVVNEEFTRVGLPPPELSRGSHGRDVVGLNWLAVEVKFQEQQNEWRMNEWWEQCKAQATASQEPILFYRKARVPWSCKMFVRLQLPESTVHIRTPGVVSYEAALLYVRHRIRRDLTNRVGVAVG